MEPVPFDLYEPVRRSKVREFRICLRGLSKE
jgi:hypothetical protein